MEFRFSRRRIDTGLRIRQYAAETGSGDLTGISRMSVDRVIPIRSMTARDRAFDGTVNDTISSRPGTRGGAVLSPQVQAVQALGRCRDGRGVSKTIRPDVFRARTSH
jgi:hypothetical protein